MRLRILQLITEMY